MFNKNVTFQIMTYCNYNFFQVHKFALLALIINDLQLKLNVANVMLILRCSSFLRLPLPLQLPLSEL